ncbi:MAG: hypothetical protein JO354_13900 [Verrucomicrobia bacterium]|nr:hypothetical protein [Verrucomicrobiota bacterium]
MSRVKLVLLLLTATMPIPAFAGGKQVLATAKKRVQYQLGPEWKLVASTKPPQAGAKWTAHNPASQSSDFDSTITMQTFQTEWPEVSARYRQLVSSIGGETSVVGTWTVRRAGARFGQYSLFSRVAYRDVADIHLVVSLNWFHLAQNDARYDAAMDASFRALLTSISVE